MIIIKTPSIMFIGNRGDSVILKRFLSNNKLEGPKKSEVPKKSDIPLKSEVPKKLDSIQKEKKRKKPTAFIDVPYDKHTFLQKRRVVRLCMIPASIFGYIYLLFTSKIYNTNYRILSTKTFHERLVWYQEHIPFIKRQFFQTAKEISSDFFLKLADLFDAFADCANTCFQIRDIFFGFSVDFPFYNIIITKVDFLAFYVEFIPHTFSLSMSNIMYMEYFVCFFGWYAYMFFFLTLSKFIINGRYRYQVCILDYIGPLYEPTKLLPGKTLKECSQLLLTDGVNKPDYSDWFKTKPDPNREKYRKIFVLIFRIIRYKQNRYKYDYTTGLFRDLPGYPRPTLLGMLRELKKRIKLIGFLKTFSLDAPNHLYLSGKYPGVDTKTFDYDLSLIELNRFTDYFDLDQCLLSIRHFLINLEKKSKIFYFLNIILKIIACVTHFYCLIILFFLFYLFFIQKVDIYCGLINLTENNILVFFFMYLVFAYLNLVYFTIQIFFFTNNRLKRVAKFLKLILLI